MPVRGRSGAQDWMDLYTIRLLGENLTFTRSQWLDLHDLISSITEDGQRERARIRERLDHAPEHPSSAGECMICGKYANKRYGGMGRYVAMCIDCWERDAG